MNTKSCTFSKSPQGTVSVTVWMSIEVMVVVGGNGRAVPVDVTVTSGAYHQDYSRTSIRSQ
jgi:hypothetical protein